MNMFILGCLNYLIHIWRDNSDKDLKTKWKSRILSVKNGFSTLKNRFWILWSVKLII